MNAEDNSSSRNRAWRYGAMWPLLSGARTTQLVYVTAKLGLADVLATGPQYSAEVAETIGAHPQILHRVMRGLVTIGLLAENDDGRFSLTPLGTSLRSDIPNSLYRWAIIWGEMLYRAWEGLLYTVRTGEPAFDHVFGMSQWDYLAQHAELGEYFHHEMARGTERAAAAVLAAYDFSSLNTIVDVGGGQGAMLAAILKAMPHMTGILYDTASVMPGARQLLTAARVAERCKLIAGDFFTEVPSDADAYIFTRIIHDWDDERSRTILMNCRRAMSEQGKLLVVEALMSERVELALHAINLDLQMLIWQRGRERTAKEYRSLLASAGFDLVAVIPTQSEMSVLEAVPV